MRREFGLVKGYTDRAGTLQLPPPGQLQGGKCIIAPTTQGSLSRSRNIGLDLKSALNLETPLDFVSTCDVGGGDYGQPGGERRRANWSARHVRRQSWKSMPDTYLYYGDEQARAVHVAVQGIAQALNKAYKAYRAAG